MSAGVGIAASVFNDATYALAPDIILAPTGDVTDHVLVVSGSEIAASFHAPTLQHRGPALRSSICPVVRSWPASSTHTIM